MANKLGLYNAALFHLGERKLASLTEAREPRRVFDDLYANVIARCLEEGQWNFAIRSVEIESAASIESTFGYQHAFTKPEDWVRTCGLSADETFSDGLTNYNDERGYWWADVDPLYVRYVSNDTEYGNDLSLWPQTYADYVALHLAQDACMRVTGSAEKEERLAKKLREAKSSALAKDAMNDAPGFAPVGSWVQSRGGSGASWRRRNRGY